VADLFRYRTTRQGPLYLAGVYVVYRCLSEPPPGREDGFAETHKVAVFVTELEASDYCDYRNRLFAERGTDALGEAWPRGQRSHGVGGLDGGKQ
jgi:hypothetical protein